MVVGTMLGPYQILHKLGEGGMGEVYKARDTRLDRSVAVKVLSGSLAADPHLRERFEREARAVSSLNHPHICTLHDVGRQGDIDYFVMELCEGETLAARLTRGPMKPADALVTAVQIADALDKAHGAGIVHRDLKPGNVMLTKAGSKLLDFGLAKASAPFAAAVQATMQPTSPNLTAQGSILGTFQYMAPEQLEGRDADARSDIFAFGAVLYEMVTGRKAFEGKSHASLIAAILEHDPPPVAALQPLAPASLDHVVGKCLAKDPDDRWQHARDLMSELKWIASSANSAVSTPAAAVPSPPTRKTPFVIVFAAGAGLIVGALTTLLMTGALRRIPGVGVTRAAISVAPAEYLQALSVDHTTNEGRPSRTVMTWSPDGGSIVFSAVRGDRQQLFVRALDQLEATPIADTEGAIGPFFSPDGRWLGFWSRGALRKVSFGSTGPATTICQAAQFFGASWGADDSIVFSQSRDGLWRVPGAGGPPQRLTTPKKDEVKHVLPEILPGGRSVLYTVAHTPLPRWDDTDIAVYSLATGASDTIVQGAADARYVRSGHLVYMKRGVLMAAPFDLRRLRTTGGAIGLVDNVMQAANMTNEAYDSGAGQFSLSESGALLYLPGGVFPDAERSLVWVDRKGAVEPLPAPPRPYNSPRLSPDGRMLAVSTIGSDRNVWLYDLGRRSWTRVMSEGRSLRAVWSPDSRSLTFGSANTGDENLFRKPVDGSGPPERLTTCDCLQAAANWSPDGQTLVFVQQQPQPDIMALSMIGNRMPRPILDTRFAENYPDLSPDGRWLAYTSNESGRPEVYVQPFSGQGARHQISVDGGVAPAWSRDGRELFYTTAETVGGQAASMKMMAVAVTLHPDFTASAPHVLFEGRYGSTAVIRGYDVAPDGRFLMVQPKERPPIDASQMIVVENWTEELKRRVVTR